MKENQNIIETRTIGELLSLQFCIPTYQRGYRWDAEQVNALLNDIDDYIIDNINTEAFYCLQPVVVAENTKKQLELIDGQQRLTTLLLILKFLNDTEFKVAKPVYQINFETREQQTNFLDIVGDEKACSDDIDLYHLHKAYNAISFWFEQTSKNNPSIGQEFYPKLINKVRVIWYEIKDKTEVIDIFTRLNIGKIPLTNAELIKALFLMKSNFQGQANLKQIQIATEWDSFEKKLQNDSFWFFIYSPENSAYYENRIEYVFDLMQHKNKNNEDYHTFNEFNIQLKNGKKHIENDIVEKKWLEVKQYFQILEEWFNDHLLYHQLGFLIEYKADINYYCKQSIELSKSDFKELLKEKIKESLNDIDLENLSYNESAHRFKIKKVLLLFNIETILQTHKSTMLFPFDKYKEEKWDIEHVTARTDKRNDNSILWCIEVLLFLTGENQYNDNFSEIDSEKTNKTIVQEKCSKLSSIEEKKIASDLINILEMPKFDSELFLEIFQEVTKYYGENDIADKDSIGNLTLLDYATNRSYGNSIFPIKRNEIIKNDSKGIFIPISTKNLFLKYYSTQVNGMRWTQQDATDYYTNIEQLLKPYLNPKFKNGK